MTETQTDREPLKLLYRLEITYYCRTLTWILSMVINHDTKLHTGHLKTIMLTKLFFTKEMEQNLPQGLFSLYSYTLNSNHEG